MTNHILPQIFNLPSGADVSRQAATNRPAQRESAHAALSTGGDASVHLSVAANPVSCVSSGHVRARDVEAARRHYVGTV